MSLQRTIAPTTWSSAFFKALATASVPRSCPHASRLISTTRHHQQSSKRELYTAPAYRPHSLPDSFPLPPRNATSNPPPSGTQPQVNETRPPPIPQSTALDPTETASIDFPTSSLPEIPISQTPPPQSPEPQPRKSKLRPRKAAITITPSALSHLRSLLHQPDPKLIRVGVKNRGCSGLAYHLEYVDWPGAFDEVVEQDGVKVLVDSKALFSIIGSEMDWQEAELSSRFVFRNPNIKEECGCGESFMV